MPHKLHKHTPHKLYNHTATKVEKDGNDLMIVFGGKRNHNGATYALDLKTMVWSKLDKVKFYYNSSHTADILLGSYIFLFGGTNFKFQFQKYDIEREAFCEEDVETIGKKPEFRFNHGSAVIHNILYIFAGCDKSFYFNDLYSFNPTSNQWQAISTIGEKPCVRKFMSFFAFHSELFVFGGEGQRGTLNDFYAFSVKTNSWEKLKKNLIKKALSPLCT